MSRPIKFRVWQNGRMLHPGDGILKEVYFDEKPWNEATDGVVEQFTGLMDKTGREIYEGDIVKASLADENGDVDDERSKQIGRVNYREDTAGFSICHTLHDSPFRVDISVLFLRGGVSRRLEIIGNIHENADLLK